MPPQLPVIAIVRVQRAALSLNFRMPGDGDIVVSCEPCSAIPEVPTGIEVFRPKPRRRFGGMSSFRPPPQLGVDVVVGQVERVLGCAVPIIVGPAPDQWAEVSDYLARGGLPMLAQIVADGA